MMAGRPRIGEPLLIRIPAELKERAIVRAGALGVSLAEVVRRALEEFLSDDR